MKEIFHRQQQLDNIVREEGIDRSTYWWLEKSNEEAQEWKVTDPDIDFEAFLMEGADVFISWVGTMRAAGVSWEMAWDAVKFKMDIIEQRLHYAKKAAGNGRPFEENYERAKKNLLKSAPDDCNP